MKAAGSGSRADHATRARRLQLVHSQRFPQSRRPTRRARWIVLPEDHFFTGFAIGLAIAVLVYFVRFP